MEELVSTMGTEITNKELKSYTTKLKTCGTNIRKNYLKISHLLTEIEKTECYLDDGFEDVQDYASKVLNIQKTTCYNLLKIGREYISETGDRTVLTDKGDDYGVSQLQALIPLGVEKSKELHDEGTITPEMSVRQIKGIVKSLTEQDDIEEDDDVVDGESGEESEEILKSFGTIEFLRDGHIISTGIIPEEFEDEVFSLFDRFKDLFEKLDAE